MDIVRPISTDGLVGFDEDGHLIHCEVSKDGERRTYTHIHDVRGKICRICQHGWGSTSQAMGDQQHWELVKEFVHLSCLARHQGLIERGQVHAALYGARVSFFGVVEIPNGYWGPDDRWGKWQPWYQLSLVNHPIMFVVGHRKNVWSIKITPQQGTKLAWAKAAEDFFTKEGDVTRDFSEDEVMMHAWGTRKLEEYIKKLAEIGGYARK